MPTFNSFTECVGIMHDLTPDCHPFPGHGCVDDLITVRSFDLQATWVIDVLGFFLTCYPWLFAQPGTGRRPVERCRNYMSVLGPSLI